MKKKSLITRMLVFVLAILMIAATTGCKPKNQPTDPPQGSTAPTNSGSTPTEPAMGTPTDSANPTLPEDPTQPNNPTEPTAPATTDPDHECDFILATEIPATCIKEGMKIYGCTICSEPQYVKLPTVDHMYVQTDRVEPTRDEPGYILKSCIYCHDTHKEEIPTSPHCDPHQFIVLQYIPATATDEGFAELACVRCGLRMTASVPVYVEEEE